MNQTAGSCDELTESELERLIQLADEERPAA